MPHRAARVWRAPGAPAAVPRGPPTAFRRMLTPNGRPTILPRMKSTRGAADRVSLAESFLLAIATVTTVAALAGAPALAQNSNLTRGVRLPFPAVSLGDQASGIDINPGGLGFLRSAELEFFATELSAGVGGSGQAVYLAAPLPFGFALGFGFNHLGTQTRTAFPELRFEDYARLSFSAAWAPSQRFSLGLSLHTLLGDAGQLNGLTTVDLGAVWRPSRWLSFGASVQDVTTPALAGSPLLGAATPGAPGGLAGLGGLASLGRAGNLHRAWLMGIGLRPGTERVFIGADLRIEELARRVDPSFRVTFEPLPGVALGGSLEVRDRDGTTEYTAQLGLTWNFDLASALRGTLGYSSYVERGRGHDGFTVGARFSGARERVTVGPSERWVKVHLKDAIPESGAPASLLGGGGGGTGWTTAGVLGVLEAARRDQRVRGVLIAFDQTGFGLAQAEEIRAAMLHLRKAGKRVIAHVAGAGNAVYLAASAADRLYLHPLSSLNTVGFASEVIYLRGLADKVGILPEFVAIGKYKSAAEQLTRKAGSKAAKEARLAFLGDAMDRLVGGLAEGRKKTPDEVRAVIERAPLTAREALAAGFADGIDYFDALPEKLRKEGTPISFVRDAGAPAGNRWGGYDRVAVVHVEGTIADGKSGVDPIFRGRSAGADTIVEALRAAKNDPRVRAVVLRVNSGGGSVTACERMWREIETLKKRKPVVASFGNFAASGGYYISAGAHEIFADAATLTGSIGVIFGKMSLAGLLRKGDVHPEVHKTAAHADLLSSTRPWDDQERAVITRLVQDTYDQFVDRVVAGRKLPRATVLELAQGRIWSGKAALGHKLVDTLGGLDAAIARAKELAGLPRNERTGVLHLPRPTFVQSLLRRLGASADDEAKGLSQLTQLLAPALLPISAPLMHLRSGEPWALLPFELDLK